MTVTIGGYCLDVARLIRDARKADSWIVRETSSGGVRRTLAKCPGEVEARFLLDGLAARKDAVKS